MKISIRWDSTDWKIVSHWLFPCFVSKHSTLVCIRIFMMFGSFVDFGKKNAPSAPWEHPLHQILVTCDLMKFIFGFYHLPAICIGYINICISRAEIKLTSIYNSVKSGGGNAQIIVVTAQHFTRTREPHQVKCFSGFYFIFGLTAGNSSTNNTIK